MRKLLLAVVLGVSSASVLAATSMPSVGVVDVQKVFADSSMVKTQKNQLEASVKQKQAALKSDQARLGKLVDQYKRNQTVMSKSEKQKLQTQVTALQSQIYQKSQLYSQQLQNAQAVAMKSFLGKLESATQQVAEQKHLTLVLPKTGVIYASSGYDVTNAVESALNK